MNSTLLRDRNGFTLIELMITVVIVGILAAIALPNYFAHVQKANRANAKTALLDLASRQESYYALNNVYASQLTRLGYAANMVSVPSSTQSYYIVSVASASMLAYSLQAMPDSTGPQVADSCGTYKLDNYGNKTNVDTAGTAITLAGCW